MTLRFPLLAACLTLASLGGLARTSDAPLPGLRAVVAGETAYLLGDAEQVAGPGVTWASAAPGGRYLLCERRRPLVNSPTIESDSVLSEVSLIAWDAKTRKASTLWKRAETLETHFHFNAMDWFPAGGAAILYLDDGETSGLVFVSPGTGTIRKVQGSAVASVHPKLPLVAVMPLSAGDPRRMVLRSDGNVAGNIEEPAGPHTTGWSADGKRMYFGRFRRGDDGLFLRDALKKPLFDWIAVEISSGKSEPRAEKPDDLVEAAETPKPALALSAESSKLTTDKTTEPTKTLWLSTKEGKSKIRVAADVDAGVSELLPDLSAVAYRQNGALFAAPLTALDKVAFEELLTRARRKKTLADAKQVGTALMMYCQDYDEEFPPSGGNLTEMVNPYLRNEDILKGFQFTYAGSRKLAEIEKPSETVLGHISGPGGRAVVFADGHVRWEEPSP